MFANNVACIQEWIRQHAIVSIKLCILSDCHTLGIIELHFEVTKVHPSKSIGLRSMTYATFYTRLVPPTKYSSQSFTCQSMSPMILTLHSTQTVHWRWHHVGTAIQIIRGIYLNLVGHLHKPKLFNVSFIIHVSCNMKSIAIEYELDLGGTTFNFFG